MVCGKILSRCAGSGVPTVIFTWWKDVLVAVEVERRHFRSGRGLGARVDSKLIFLVNALRLVLTFIVSGIGQFTPYPPPPPFSVGARSWNGPELASTMGKGRQSQQLCGCSAEHYRESYRRPNLITFSLLQLDKWGKGPRWSVGHRNWVDRGTPSLYWQPGEQVAI